MAKIVSVNPVIPKTTERQFYSRTRAFGRFGMRIFKPTLMERAHWHGHVEANYIRNARMIYFVDGQRIVVEPDHLVLFWAGIPHQLVAVDARGVLETLVRSLTGAQMTLRAGGAPCAPAGADSAAPRAR